MLFPHLNKLQPHLFDQLITNIQDIDPDSHVFDYCRVTLPNMSKELIGVYIDWLCNQGLYHDECNLRDFIDGGQGEDDDDNFRGAQAKYFNAKAAAYKPEWVSLGYTLPNTANQKDHHEQQPSSQMEDVATIQQINTNTSTLNTTPPTFTTTSDNPYLTNLYYTVPKHPFIHQGELAQDIEFPALLDTGSVKCFWPAGKVPEYAFVRECKPFTIGGVTGGECIISHKFSLYCRLQRHKPVMIDFYVINNYDTAIIGVEGLERLGCSLSFNSLSKYNITYTWSPFQDEFRTITPIQEEDRVKTANKMFSNLKPLFERNKQLLNEPRGSSHRDAIYDMKLMGMDWYAMHSYPKNYNAEGLKLIGEEIERLVDIGVLEEIPPGVGKVKVNYVLARRKGSDKIRLCIDAVNMNKYIKPSSVPIMSPQVLFDKLNKGKCEYMTAIDLKDAYYVMKFKPEHQN